MTAFLDTIAVDKQEAFEALPDQVSTPIKAIPGNKFKFTRKWFRSRNQTTFSTLLPPRFPPDKPYNVIQIGVFEGADLVWQFQNLLCHEDSRVMAIDPWAKTRKLDQDQMDAVYARARRNLKPWHSKINMVRGYSQDVLTGLVNGTQIGGKHINPGEWDLIVIDGDHVADAVYTDAVLSLPLCRPGGWMLFDDVRNRSSKKNHVYHGIIGWLLEYGTEVEMAWANRFMNCYEKKS